MAYYFPWLVRLNGEPALNITLIASSPRPPLLICGGVVGLLAEKIGDEETYMTLRVVSAQRKRQNNWFSESNRLYQILVTTNLSQAFTPLGAPTISSGTNSSFTNAGTGPAQFFRIEQLGP